MFAEILLPLPLNKIFHYSIPENLEGSVKPGVRVVVPFGSKKMTGYVYGLIPKALVPNVKDISSVLDSEAVLTEELASLGKWISQTYGCSLGEAFAAIVSPSLNSPKRAEKAKDLPSQYPEAELAHKLTESQKKAAETILEAVNKKEFRAFLLHGITSSGKTEVYLKLIEEMLRLGRSSIFLIPEISLTPHFISIVQRRFPGKVGIWHSNLSGGEKYKTWRDARAGTIKIVIGPRSAVFSPLKDLGLIIVDEEHEPGYKQEQKPTYHAREAALERARLNKAVVILGSATPSLESYFRAKNGEFVLLELKERIGSGALPPVRIVDSRNEYKKSKMLSAPLVEALSRALARREQAIIFLNRRGFAPGVACENCGEIFQCPNCSISLVYHINDRKIKCHYCGYERDLPESCPVCGKKDIRIFGVGTQKVEHELKRIFPQAKIVRLDRDTTKKKGLYQTAYDDFRKENVDILLGTQMIAKGFDFPRVTFVGVIDADTSLFFPDFRSAERTFQLLTQVAGRSGRSILGGEVVIQSRHPEHYSLLCAKDHDYTGFYEKEIGLRKQMGYPPFSQLANIILKGKNEQKVLETARSVFDHLNGLIKENGGFNVLGPTPASRVKLQSMFRWQILLKGQKDAIIQAVLAVKKFAVPSGILLTVDADPYDIL